MTKKRKKQMSGSISQSPRNTAVYLAVGLVIVVVALLAFGGVFGSGGDATVEGVSLLSPQDYQAEFVESTTDYVLIDVRTPGEFSSGHIANSVNIPVESLQSRIAEVPQGMPVVVYCRSGNRSATAARILSDAGFSDVYDLGGTIGWTSAGYPLEN